MESHLSFSSNGAAICQSGREGRGQQVSLASRNVAPGKTRSWDCLRVRLCSMTSECLSPLLIEFRRRRKRPDVTPAADYHTTQIYYIPFILYCPLFVLRFSDLRPTLVIVLPFVACQLLGLFQRPCLGR